VEGDGGAMGNKGHRGCLFFKSVKRIPWRKFPLYIDKLK
jgi:hypothetical protein